MACPGRPGCSWVLGLLVPVQAGAVAAVRGNIGTAGFSQTL